MLAPLSHTQQPLTLIADSGIQFICLALPAQSTQPVGRFVRKTANGPLLKLAWDAQSERCLLSSSPSVPPEVVKPECTFSIDASLTALDGEWLPLPVQRSLGSSGPDNWARVQVSVKGEAPRITLAFDTRLLPEDQAQLGPTAADVRNGCQFIIPWENHSLESWLDMPWIDSWLRDVFEQHASAGGEEPAQIELALKRFEYQAHWINVLTLLGEHLSIPEITLVSATLQTPAIPVDLILDVGNSHSFGLLAEDQGPGSAALRLSTPLHIRSLAQAHLTSEPLFTSRVEFNEARFGSVRHSTASGRSNAFHWPSMVRVGDDARMLALTRTGTEGASGVSSPRRYLWDSTPSQRPWRQSLARHRSGPEPFAITGPIQTLINDEGEPLWALAAEDRLPVFTPSYSRSSLMTQMLCELLAQAICQANSLAHRQQMGAITAPRQLHNIILTLPSAMPERERSLFAERMQQAIGLVWKALGWHPQDETWQSDGAQNSCTLPAPKVHAWWDEATCGQLPWLYNESQTRYQGDCRALFNDLARPDLESHTQGSLRVALIDIGGGTTDMAITHYQLDDAPGGDGKITPTLMFREGFRLAGDDILLDVIRRCVLPAISQQLARAGVKNTSAAMNTLFGDQGRQDASAVLRQQATLQLFIPAAQAILQAWEQADMLTLAGGITLRLGDVPGVAPGERVLAHIHQQLAPWLGNEADPKLLDTRIEVSFSALQAALLTGEFAISRPLIALCEAIHHAQCDLLLMTGRPTGLPGIKALIQQQRPVPVSCQVWLSDYRWGDWYPVAPCQGCAKSTAAVGALLCSLALELRLPQFNFHAAHIGTWDTVRYFGQLSSGGDLPDETVWYRDINLDNPGETLDARLHFPVRGPVMLGYRQLDNAHWPATPLYVLEPTHPSLSRALAADGVLNVRLQLDHHPATRLAQGFSLAAAWMQDGTPVPLAHLQLRLHTLGAHSTGASHYWIDSGSVFQP